MALFTVISVVLMTTTKYSLFTLKVPENSPFPLMLLWHYTSSAPLNNSLPPHVLPSAIPSTAKSSLQCPSHQQEPPTSRRHSSTSPPDKTISPAQHTSSESPPPRFHQQLLLTSRRLPLQFPSATHHHNSTAHPQHTHPQHSTPRPRPVPSPSLANHSPQQPTSHSLSTASHIHMSLP